MGHVDTKPNTSNLMEKSHLLFLTHVTYTSRKLGEMKLNDPGRQKLDGRYSRQHVKLANCYYKALQAPTKTREELLTVLGFR